uniref:Uncharacterized protein n=1 Tax=Ursus maritimus TaxID=29073 RepID=A0A452UWR9_URSMA
GSTRFQTHALQQIMGVSFRSLLGDGLACSLPAFGGSLAAFVSRALSLGGCAAPPRRSGSSSSCPCGSQTLWSGRTCLKIFIQVQSH